MQHSGNVMRLSVLAFVIASLGGLVAVRAAEPANKKRDPSYNERADARAQIAEALARAKRDNKRALLMWGGNWCKWCYRLHDVFEQDKAVRETLRRSYELVLIDFNANPGLGAGYQIERSFPYLTVLDADGKLLKNQSTGEFEVGDKHDPAKVLAFLNEWKPAGPPSGRSLAEQQAILRKEVQRSKPDYIVYVPRSLDGSTHDLHNEHFLVFEGPDGSLMAIWTQNINAPNGPVANRIRFTKSTDNGVTWAEPSHVVGPRTPDDPTHMASWAFPMVSKSGRIYVIYNQNQGNGGWIQMHTGTMDGLYSDDNGATWSKPQNIPMPRSPYDDPTGKIPGEWIVWQIPMRDLKGGYFVGYTHWVNRAVAALKKVESWTQIESVVEFMRFENIDENPEPKDLRVKYSAWGDQALRVPHFMYPLCSVAQEPSLVRLPDKRLFCVMRTNSGYIWYSISTDDGQPWCNPRPLLRKDHGLPILQPVGCCPIYQLADGRYVLLHHNNRGDIVKKPEATSGPRRPAFIALGEFRPGADQPIWFSESKQLMDTDGFRADGTPPVEGRHGSTDIGVYSSFTTRDGVNVLWHPDRKTFLVGKKITPEFLADLKVPER